MNYLPNVDRAHIGETKIIGYLLSRTHPGGRAKARFFMRHGFQVSDWKVFRSAIIQHAIDNRISTLGHTSFGTKFIIDGPISTPDGRNPYIRAIWFVEVEKDEPRLVTAYPLKGAG